MSTQLEALTSCQPASPAVFTVQFVVERVLSEPCEFVALSL